MTTLTDRELLEGAAKAAGIKGEYNPNYLRFCANKPPDGIRTAMGYNWNTLEDDADALRTHAKLYQSIGIPYIEMFEDFLQEELCKNPSYAAACFRCAITRAAYEISKGMK